jgi:hypothetical protein
MQADFLPAPKNPNQVLRRLPCIFVLSGGLGNQLFTYAAGLYFSKHNNRKVVFEISDTDLLKEYHTSTILKMNPRRPVVKLRFRKSIIRAISLTQRLVSFLSPSRVIYGSPELGHDAQMEKNSYALLVRGHYQTYKYFLDKDVAREMNNLSIIETTDSFSMQNGELVGKKALGIHARLGNYIELQDSFGSLSSVYFRAAIEAALSDERFKIDYIYLFSEDVEQAIEYISLKEWGIPIRLIGKDSGMTDEETLVLMSNCDSLVISNSTFSWWAAALGNQDKRVYAPATWFKGMNDPVDLYPPHWNLIHSSWR